MPDYLQSRIAFLRRVQNPDGGWGYFPGKASWLEPTAYAILALHGLSGAGAATERAWAAISTWQLPDGGWRPSAQIGGATWVTALALTVCCARQVYGDRLERTLGWLKRMEGAESSLPMRAASFFHLLKTDVDVSHKAWPWRPGTASWIEPTAQALIALKKIPEQYRSRHIAYRIREGEDMILARRDRDGGWNSGNPNVLKTDLPSYPETTAIALLGLQGRGGRELIEAGRQFGVKSKSSLANAWLAIALRCYGESCPVPGNARESRDTMLAALEALGHPEGNYRLVRV
ncbi:MAG: prenyltransferase/squalene oxidase repeat-containing protein [Bryobacteraceae bacterium]